MEGLEGYRPGEGGQRVGGLSAGREVAAERMQWDEGMGGEY